MYNSMTINQTASSQGAAQSLLTNMKPRASSAMLSNRRYYYQKSGIDNSSYGHSNSSNSNQDSYSYNLPKLFGGSGATDGTAASATKTITFEGNKSSSSSSYDPNSPSIVPQPTASDSIPVPTISSSPPVGGGFQHLSATIPGAGSTLPRAQSASGYRKSIPINSLFSQTNNSSTSSSVGVVSNSNSSLGVVGGYGSSVTGRPPLGNSAGPLHSTRAMLVRPSSGSVSRSTVTTGSMSISTNAPQPSVQLESRSSSYSTYNASKLQLQSILKKSTTNAIDRPAGTQQDSGLTGGPSKGPGGSPHESPLLDKDSSRRKVVFAHPLTSSHPLSNPFEFQSLPSPSSGRRGEASNPMAVMPQGAKTVRGPNGPIAADAVLSSSNAKMMESSNSNSTSKESGTGSSSSSSSSSPPVSISPPPSGSPLTQHPPVKSGGFPSTSPSNTNSNAGPLYRVMSTSPAAVGGTSSSTSSQQQQQSIRSATPPLDVDICEAVSGPIENSRTAGDIHDSNSITAQKKLFVKISRDDGISVQINAGGNCDSTSSSDDRGAAMPIAPIMRLESFSSDVGEITETAYKTGETPLGEAPPNTTANSVSTDRDRERDNSKPRADSTLSSLSADSVNKKPASSAAAISLLIEASATKDKQTATSSSSSSSSSSKRKSSSFRPSLSDQLAQIGAKASAITSEIRSKNPQESFFSSSLNSAISLGRNANAIYMHSGSGAEESSASSSYEGVGVGMLFSMPSKSFSVGSLTCKYPSPALFYSDRLEYAFNHPYEATCISMVVFYRDMQTVNIVGTKLRFKLPRKLSLFLGDFDPHNPLHMIVLEVTTASSISAIRDKVLPLIAQCR